MTWSSTVFLAWGLRCWSEFIECYPGLIACYCTFTYLSTLDRIYGNASYRICKELFKLFFISCYGPGRGAPAWKTEQLRSVELECFHSQMSGFISSAGCINVKEQNFQGSVWLSPGLGVLEVRSEIEIPESTRQALKELSREFCPQLLWLSWPLSRSLCSRVSCVSSRYCHGSCHLSSALDSELSEVRDYLWVIFLSLTQELLCVSA